MLTVGTNLTRRPHLEDLRIQELEENWEKRDLTITFRPRP